MKCDGCDKRVSSLSELQSWTYHEKLKNVFCTDVCYATKSQDGKKNRCAKAFTIKQVFAKEKIHSILYADENTQLTYTVMKPLEKIVKKEGEKELPLLHPNSTHYIMLFKGEIDVYLYRDGKPYANPVRIGGPSPETPNFFVIPQNTQHRIENSNAEATFMSTFSPPALSDDEDTV